MGQDKAWMQIQGEPMIRRVIRELAPVASSTAIIANAPEYSSLGLPVYADSLIGIGPIEGIRTALSNCPTECALLVACDMPFVTSDLLALLLKKLPGFDVVAPKDLDGKIEPLCAVYTKNVLPVVTDLIDTGHRKPSRIYECVRTNFLPFSALDHLPGATTFFKNVNSPEDYAEAIGLAQR